MDFSIVTYFRPAKSVIPFNKSKRAFCMAESWIGLCNRFMAESPHLRVVVCTPLARRDGNLATRFFFYSLAFRFSQLSTNRARLLRIRFSVDDGCWMPKADAELERRFCSLRSYEERTVVSLCVPLCNAHSETQSMYTRRVHYRCTL